MTTLAEMIRAIRVPSEQGQIVIVPSSSVGLFCVMREYRTDEYTESQRMRLSEIASLFGEETAKKAGALRQ